VLCAMFVMTVPLPDPRLGPIAIQLPGGEEYGLRSQALKGAGASRASQVVGRQGDMVQKDPAP